MEFVFDRTQADVDRAKELNNKYIAGVITEEEKSEWDSGVKGALNVSDLNRIEANIHTLSGHFACPVITRQWNSAEIPRSSDYLRIRDNIQSIKSAWFGLSQTPEVPEQPLNSFEKWNDIERILHDLNYTYERYVNGFYYCGETYAGEGIGDL